MQIILLFASTLKYHCQGFLDNNYRSRIFYYKAKEGGINRNGRVRISKVLLYHKTEENTNKHCLKQLFQNSKIYQILATMQRALTFKNLNMSKNNRMCDVRTSPIPTKTQR